MMRLIVILCVAVASLLSSFNVNAQYFMQRNGAIPVAEGSNVFDEAWFGGLNCPQFNDIDLDNDNIEDLVIFNRGSFDAGGINNSHKLLTFINEGTPNQVSYRYAPEYEHYFPELHHWLLIKDWNCDGVEDLFSSYSAAGAIELYLGSRVGNNLSFTSVGYLEYPSFSGSLNVFVSAIDIPAIEDINGDGDLDVLTFNVFGGVMGYYENQSQELTGTCGDTMAFELSTECWGEFYETGLSVAVVLDSSCVFKKDPDLDAQGGARHPGSTTLAFDEDGDGDMEIIIGDISFKQLNRLVNGDTNGVAHIIAEDPNFPSYTRPFELSIFPAAFYMDVNNDGRKDLIAAPNSPKKSENWSCSWLYTDIGTTDTVVFDFVTDSFIVDESIDLGEGSYPVFFDYNADGLLDIVAGNYGYFVATGVYKSGLAVFENVGTSSAPAYNLVDRDYMGISSLLVDNLSVQNVTPTFADLDDDGDLDLMIGDESGQLHYYTNTAGAGNPASFTLTGAKYKGIDIGSFSSPFFYDVNNDGLIDMLIGENRGNVNYYQNRGTKSVPDFDSAPTNSLFGGITVNAAGFITGYSMPIITTLDGSGTKYVLVGSEIGRIQGFILDESKILGGNFVRAFSSYSDINEGERVSLTVADITGNGKMEMVTGNYRGGLTFYGQIDSIYIGLADNYNKPIIEASIFPNPNTGEFTVNYNSAIGELVTIELYDLSGQLILTQNVTQPQTTINATDFAKGMYLVKISKGTSSVTQKLIIR